MGCFNGLSSLRSAVGCCEPLASAAKPLLNRCKPLAPKPLATGMAARDRHTTARGTGTGPCRGMPPVRGDLTAGQRAISNTASDAW